MGNALDLTNKLTTWNLGGFGNRRQKLAEIAFENSAVVDDLLKEAKRLIKNGNESEAEKLINFAERIVNNNRKYQNMVVDFLHKAD